MVTQRNDTIACSRLAPDFSEPRFVPAGGRHDPLMRSAPPDACGGCQLNPSGIWCSPS